MRELTVYFKDIKINNKMSIDLDKVQEQPKIQFTPANKFYTILMVDPDAPSAEDPVNKYWLHWLVMNNNEVVVRFNPPKPPKNTGKHRYCIYLLEQQTKIKDLPTYDRPKFPLIDFCTKYKLKLVACVMFKTEKL